MTTKHIVALKERLVNLTDANQDNLAMAMSVQHQLMNYGFMLSRDAFEMLKKADTADIIDFHRDVISYLKDMIGDGSFKSLYGNFPHDVMSMTRYELYYTQLIHYWTNATFNVATKPRETAFEQVVYKTIEAASDARFMQIFTDLCSVNQSLTPTHQETLRWFAANVDNLVYPKTIPFKENLGTLVSILPSLKLATVTDVMRVAAVWSGQDVSLPRVPRVNKNSKKYAEKAKERKAFDWKLTSDQKDRIMSLLESSNLNVSEMNQGSRYGRWIKLAQHLQFGRSKQIEFSWTIIKYPNTIAAFNHLRNQKRKGKPDGMPKIRGWYSQLDSAFKLGLTQGLKILVQRPGEFLRRLDNLFLKYKAKDDTKTILLALSGIAEDSSNKVIFETLEWFEGRDKPITNRSVFIKGARNRTPLPNKPALSLDVIKAVKDTLWTAIKEKFKKLPALGKCWIDPELKKIPLPTNMRSMSESLVISIRGQRMPISTQPNAQYVRAYCHWFNDGKRPSGYDIDLTAHLVSKTKHLTVGWDGDRTKRNALYSGDVTNRSGACAEYIDINIDSLVNEGWEYVIFDARDYKRIGFNTYPQCVFGYMEISIPHANNTWQPQSVANAIKINTKASGVTICALDLRTREYIWIDSDSQMNVASRDTQNLQKLLQTYVILPEVSVYDLLTWHVAARGELVTQDEAEKQFLFDDFSSSYVETLKYLGV